jgi:hypothetical protein
MSRPRTGSETEILTTFLDQQRDVVMWKLDGLTDDQLRQRIRPGGLYLLGLVKHLASAEYDWLSDLFGRPSEPADLRASDDAEVEPGDTTDSVLNYYSRARNASDQAMSDVDFDTTAVTWLGDTVSFRWAILHTIEASVMPDMPTSSASTSTTPPATCRTTFRTDKSGTASTSPFRAQHTRPWPMWTAAWHGCTDD